MNRPTADSRRRHVLARSGMAIPASVAILVVLTGCGAAEQPPASSVPAPTTTATPSRGDATPSQTASEPTPLDGTYAITWGVEELTKALGGADNPTAAMDARNNDGTVRLVFDRGRYDMRYERDGSSCPGTFVVNGDRVVMTATTKPSEWHCGDGLGALVADAAWQLAGDELRFSDFKPSATPGISWFMGSFLGTKPLQRES